MKNWLSISVLGLLFVSGCDNLESLQPAPELRLKIVGFSEILETKDQQKIDQICTDKGMNGLLEWTDSLRSDYLDVIADNLSSKKITYSVSDELEYSIDIMENGEQTGSLQIILQDDKALIDGFMGSSVVH